MGGKSLDFYGSEDFQKHRRFDLVYMPCEPIQLTESNKHLVEKECIVDLKDEKAKQKKLQETIKYLKDPHITVISNKQRVKIFSYNEESVHSESVVQSR